MLPWLQCKVSTTTKERFLTDTFHKQVTKLNDILDVFFPLGGYLKSLPPPPVLLFFNLSVQLVCMYVCQNNITCKNITTVELYILAI